MKTQHLFDEYNEYINNQEQSILDLTKQKQELQSRNKDNQSKYKELIANGEDEKADELFSVIAEDDKKLNAINKRLDTKKEVSQEARDKKTVELLKHQKDLSRLYANEKSELIEKLKSIVDQYNTVIEKIESVNEDYAEEHARFVDVYQSEDIFKKSQNDKLIKSELRNNFHETQYSDFINASELPFIYDKKLQFKGAK
ncbi:pathogenicity island protein [Staphylococcus equorum]|uniref:pathogenicity island protein n=1 Tax=Staphylococcus equorum TaxID=246432 RepID=UPI002DBFACEC|nr:pathogenicity island protein [Staphylococcus equorum]MEB7675191.1 pathogenicity island protein [Staphylococcus equorum]